MALYNFDILMDVTLPRKTVCRRFFRVSFEKSKPEDRAHALAVCRLCKLDDAASKSLRSMSNGDWTSKFIVHHCAFDCCRSSEEGRKTHTVAVEVELTGLLATTMYIVVKGLLELAEPDKLSSLEHATSA